MKLLAPLAVMAGLALIAFGGISSRDRRPDEALFTDGFESGSASTWSHCEGCLVFADGFESRDCGQWSSCVGVWEPPDQLARIWSTSWIDHPPGYGLCGFMDYVTWTPLPGWESWRCRELHIEFSLEPGADIWFEARLLRWYGDGEAHAQLSHWDYTGFETRYYELPNTHHLAIIDVPGPCPCLLGVWYIHPVTMMQHGTGKKIDW